MYVENGYFYLVGAGGLIYKSSNITSGFTKLNLSNNLTHGYEADYLVKLDNGKWRMYRQELSTAHGTAHMTYCDADTIEGTWSDPKYVKYTEAAIDYIDTIRTSQTVEYFHWTVYDFNETNDNNNNFID